MRYFLKLCYKGTRFHGWQRQPKHTSIQETIEDALGIILQRPISCHGCGRTDAGVHASIYYVHIDLYGQEALELIYRAKKCLEADINLLELLKMHNGANAQRDAIRRTYIYDFHVQKNPFILGESTWYPMEKIKLTEMQKVATLLPSYQDYLPFCKTPNQHQSTICNVEEAGWREVDQGRFQFTISADHFLRGMIRLLVGNMLEIGAGRMEAAQMLDHLSQKTVPKFFQMAPARGLHLAEVKYPYELS